MMTKMMMMVWIYINFELCLLVIRMICQLAIQHLVRLLTRVRERLLTESSESMYRLHMKQGLIKGSGVVNSVWEDYISADNYVI